MPVWIAPLAGLLGFAAGVGVTVYFARMAVRHTRLLERRAFMATLKRHAEWITEESDPLRVAAGLRLEAQVWQRSADALKFRKEN